MSAKKLSSGKGAITKQLVIGVVVAVTFIVFGVAKAVVKPAQTPEAVAKPTTEARSPAAKRVSLATKVDNNRDAKKREKAQVAIREHQDAMIHDPEGPETGDRLMAIGNLNQYQIEDYYSAIDSYRMMVSTSPDHPDTPQAYAEMASCYEKLGEDMQARYIYEEMINELDPSLSHVLYAKVMLDS
jgi:tetratricopeptide (TPR) repeat protein